MACRNDRQQSVRDAQKRETIKGSYSFSKEALEVDLEQWTEVARDQVLGDKEVTIIEIQDNWGL